MDPRGLVGVLGVLLLAACGVGNSTDASSQKPSRPSVVLSTSGTCGGGEALILDGSSPQSVQWLPVIRVIGYLESIAVSTSALLPSNRWNDPYQVYCWSGGGASGPITAPEVDPEADLFCEQLGVWLTEEFEDALDGPATADAVEDECPDCLIDLIVLAADILDFVQNGVTCSGAVAFSADLIAALVPGVPAVFGHVSKAERYRALREVAAAGRSQHEAFSATLRSNGDLANVRLPSGKRMDGVIADPVTGVLTVVELKPSTTRAGVLGNWQLFGRRTANGAVLREGYVEELIRLKAQGVPVILRDSRTGGTLSLNQFSEIRGELRSYDLLNWQPNY